MIHEPEFRNKSWTLGYVHTAVTCGPMRPILNVFSSLSEHGKSNFFCFAIDKDTNL